MIKVLTDMSWPRRLNLLLLVAAITALPFWLFIVPRILTFFVLSSIIVSIHEKQKFQLRWEYVALFSLYCLYALSYFWSDNKEVALNDMERKLTLLIFPVLFSFMSFSKGEIRILLSSFLIGLLIAIPLDFYRASLLFAESGNLSSFFYDALAKPHHPGYLSMYVNFGCVILIADYFTSSLELFKKNWPYYLIGFLLFVFNFLLVSKIGLIVSFVLLVTFMVLYVKKNKTYWVPLISIVIGISAFSAVYNYSPYARNTINELFQNSSYSAAESDTKAQGSVSLRWVIWDASVGLIAEKPILGYGSGDVQDNLLKQYEEDEQPFALVMNLNAHNQFLQTTLALGVLGLALLVFIIVRMVQFSLRNKAYILLGFCLIVCSNFFIESVLKVQAGTMFFGLFYCLLMVKTKVDEA